MATVADKKQREFWQNPVGFPWSLYSPLYVLFLGDILISYLFSKLITEGILTESSVISILISYVLFQVNYRRSSGRIWRDFTVPCILLYVY
jgi:hypothetical protein